MARFVIKRSPILVAQDKRSAAYARWVARNIITNEYLHMSCIGDVVGFEWAWKGNLTQWENLCKKYPHYSRQYQLVEREEEEAE